MILFGSITAAISFLVCFRFSSIDFLFVLKPFSKVASKCGLRVINDDGAVTNSPAHIEEYIEGTINRLGFAPDLYYLHRIDPSKLKPRQSITFRPDLSRHSSRRVDSRARWNPEGRKDEVHRSIRVQCCDIKQSPF